MTEDEVVEWYHQHNEHGFEQTPGDGKGQGSLACCSSWGHKESSRLNLEGKQQQQNVWEDARVWPHGNHLLDCSLIVWGQNPGFVHPESPQDSQSGVATVAGGFSCNILCVLVWQGTLLIHTFLLCVFDKFRGKVWGWT